MVEVEGVTDEAKVAPFFTVTILPDGQYQVESNLGSDYWQWWVLKLAAEIRRGL